MSTKYINVVAADLREIHLFKTMVNVIVPKCDQEQQNDKDDDDGDGDHHNAVIRYERAHF